MVRPTTHRTRPAARSSRPRAGRSAPRSRARTDTGDIAGSHSPPRHAASGRRRGRPGRPACSRDAGVGVEQRGEHPAVVSVRAADQHVQRQPVAVTQHVMLRPGLAPIGRGRPGHLAPRSARTLTESTAARDQSKTPARPSRSSTTRCSWCQTPARSQARSRRQHVVPDPQPSSSGRSFGRIPVLSTNTIPASTARSGTRGRPVRAPRRRHRGWGISGSTSSRTSSDTSSCAVDPSAIAHDHRNLVSNGS